MVNLMINQKKNKYILYFLSILLLYQCSSLPLYQNSSRYYLDKENEIKIRVGYDGHLGSKMLKAFEENSIDVEYENLEDCIHANELDKEKNKELLLLENDDISKYSALGYLHQIQYFIKSKQSEVEIIRTADGKSIKFFKTTNESETINISRTLNSLAMTNKMRHLTEVLYSEKFILNQNDERIHEISFSNNILTIKLRNLNKNKLFNFWNDTYFVSLFIVNHFGVVERKSEKVENDAISLSLSSLSSEKDIAIITILHKEKNFNLIDKHIKADQKSIKPFYEEFDKKQFLDIDFVELNAPQETETLNNIGEFIKNIFLGFKEIDHEKKAIIKNITEELLQYSSVSFNELTVKIIDKDLPLASVKPIHQLEISLGLINFIDSICLGSLDCFQKLMAVVIAHEISHYKNDDFKRNRGILIEMKADIFSGLILVRSKYFDKNESLVYEYMETYFKKLYEEIEKPKYKLIEKEKMLHSFEFRKSQTQKYDFEKWKKTTQKVFQMFEDVKAPPKDISQTCANIEGYIAKSKNIAHLQEFQRLQAVCLQKEWIQKVGTKTLELKAVIEVPTFSDDVKYSESFVKEKGMVPEEKLYNKALSIYEKVLRYPLYKNDPLTNSNYATLLAFRNPQDALTLARRTEQLKSNYQTKSNYAFTLYMNGKYADSITSEQKQKLLSESLSIYKELSEREKKEKVNLDIANLNRELIKKELGMKYELLSLNRSPWENNLSDKLK